MTTHLSKTEIQMRVEVWSPIQPNDGDFFSVKVASALTCLCTSYLIYI